MKKNTPGTAGGPGGRDQTLAAKSRKISRKSFFSRKKIITMHISSSYAKILGGTNFRTQEIPQSGSKAKDGGGKKKKKN